jgi:hypothetical protein
MARSILFLAAIAIAACSTKNPTKTTPPEEEDAGPAGAAAPGAPRDHCALADGGRRVQKTDPGACDAGIPGDVTGDDGGGDDGGGDAAATSDNPYGDTMFGIEGDDDDCKYHLKWSATPIRQGTDVTFNLAVTKTADGTPLAGGAVRTEVFLSLVHPAPDTNETWPESPAGTYAVGPVRFDAPGRWTVRFHIDEQCSDFDEASPHGHAAFFVDVP